MGLRKTLFLASITFCVFGQAAAESRIPTLDRGMGYLDVIKLWGAPTEKQQFETKRKDIWYFPYGRVSFSEGRVRDWAISGPSTGKMASALNNKRSTQVGLTGRESKESDPALVEEILEEIMKEAPVQEDKPGIPGVVGAPPSPPIVPGGMANQ